MWHFLAFDTTQCVSGRCLVTPKGNASRGNVNLAIDDVGGILQAEAPDNQ
jgi:hypothetical protein